MPDVGGVSNRGASGLPTDNRPLDKSIGQAAQPSLWPDALDPLAPATKPAAQTADTPIGPRGPLGQPTGMPVPVEPGKSEQVLPDAIAGRDPTQLIAAEQMRQAGGASATAELLGLNLQPTMIGAFLAPPGNSEALRHLTPTMRRATVRSLLIKQRAQMRRLVRLLDRDSDERHSNEDDEQTRDAFDQQPRNLPYEKERGQLASAVGMLCLLEELLAMQDYTISRMGTFSKG